MADKSPLRPEKELLKLIENPASSSSARLSGLRRQGHSFFSFNALKARLAFIFNSAISSRREFRHPDIKTLNFALKIFIFIMVFYLGVSLYFSMEQLRKISTFKLQMAGISQAQSATLDAVMKPESFYLEKIRERNIFKMEERKLSIDSKTLNVGPSQEALDATAHLRLVGISWSDDPDAMIEDTKNQRTLFLKRGQKIDNEVRIGAIFKDKVILRYKAEEIEIK